MADQSDVETIVVGLIGAVLYPQGTAAPCILGCVCRIYRGWPNAAALDADLAAGRVNITVFPQMQGQHNTTRWLDESDVIMRAQPTLTVAVEGSTATFGGVAEPGQVAGLRADDMAVVHRTAAGDTPALVAAILASQLRTHRITLLSGASVTVPNVNLLIGRTVVDQTVQQATRRQLQEFRITCWCPDPGTRDLAAASVDAGLSGQRFIALPDGTFGRLRFVSSTVFDQSQDAALYRRDLLYSVEYATTTSTTLPSMIFGDVTIAPTAGGTVKVLLA